MTSFLKFLIPAFAVCICVGIVFAVLLSLPALAGMAIMGQQIDWREWLGVCVALGGSMGALVGLIITAVEA